MPAQPTTHHPKTPKPIQVTFDHGEELVRLLQQPWEGEEFWPTKDVQGAELKQPTKTALAIVEQTDPWDKCDEIHIYTDGSIAVSKAGWGMVVLGVTTGTKDYKYMGTAGGTLKEGDKTMGDPKAEDIANAEVAAVLTAIRWVLQLRHRPALLTVHTDSLLTAGAVEGHAGWANAPDIFKVLQAYHRAAKELMSVNVQHIKGHVDHPWNEMADVIADVARKGTYHNAPQQEVPQPLRNCQTTQQWLWYFAMSKKQKQDMGLPQSQGNTMMLTQPQWDWNRDTLIIDQDPMTHEQNKINTKQKSVQVDLRIVTYNVQSLAKPDKAVQISKQCKKNGYHIIAIQESGTSTAGQPSDLNCTGE